jgi:hypothetical protein
MQLFFFPIKADPAKKFFLNVLFLQTEQSRKSIKIAFCFVILIFYFLEKLPRDS